MNSLKVQTNWLTAVLSAVFFIIIWQLVVILGDYGSFILPAPLDVVTQLVTLATEGDLVHHTLYTLSEVLLGLLIGFVLAILLGYLLAKSPLAERLLSPYLIASQSIPVVAIAPLLTIWIRSIYWSHVLIAVIVVFFPILINVVAGLRSVPHELHDLMVSLRASRWQIFVKLEFPAALPILLAGLKVGATLSVIGSLVGEFVRPSQDGLGHLLLRARYLFKTDMVFAILITLGIMTLIMYGLVTLLEKRLLKWQMV